MRHLYICLLVLGLATFSRGSKDQQSASLQDLEEVSVEIDEDLLTDSEDEYSPEDDLLDFPQEDDSLQESDADLEEDLLDDLPDLLLQEDDQNGPVEKSDAGLEEEESDGAFKEALLKAFKTWNADVRACDGEKTCLARVNNVLRPMVNEAADRGFLSVIDPCEDRVGTYEVDTVDGWTIEATLPC